MSKTQAEKQRDYRARQKAKNSNAHGNGNAPVMDEGNAPNLTQVCRCCGGPTQHPKVVKCLKCCTAGQSDMMSQASAGNTEISPPNFYNLPADVQAGIESQCAENNDGQRSGSHSRAAMTERALRYQGMFGKRPSHGVHGAGCATEQENRQTEQDANMSGGGARSYIDHCTKDSGVLA